MQPKTKNHIFEHKKHKAEKKNSKRSRRVANVCNFLSLNSFSLFFVCFLFLSEKLQILHIKKLVLGERTKHTPKEKKNGMSSTHRD